MVESTRAVDVNGHKQKSPAFRLRPTGRLWAWVLLGTSASSLVLLPHWVPSLLVLAVGASWLLILLRRIAATTPGKLNFLGGREDYFHESPYATRRRGWLVWIPAAVAVILAPALTLLWNLPADVNPGTPRELSFLPILVFHGCAWSFCLAYWIIYRVRTSTLELPGLDRWFAELGKPWQTQVRRATDSPPPYASRSWRHFPDLSSDVNSAGMTLGLFGEVDGRPIWRKSTQYIIWYFAPIVVPLYSLFAAPLVQNALFGAASITDQTKLAFGVNSLAWLAWSVSYYVASASQDFTTPSDNLGARYPRSVADLLGFPNRELRRVARGYFEAQGVIVFNLLALVLVPLYMGFIGLFPGGAGAVAATSETSPAPAVLENTVIMVGCGCCQPDPKPPQKAQPPSGKASPPRQRNPGCTDASPTIKAATPGAPAPVESAASATRAGPTSGAPSASRNAAREEVPIRSIKPSSPASAASSNQQ